MTFSIASRKIGPGHSPYMIAEIGINHGGDPQLAKDMIRAAAKSGADAVKFQVFKADQFISRASEYYHIFQDTELMAQVIAELDAVAREVGITIFSAVFDMESAEAMRKVNAVAYKIASGDLTHLPLLRYVSKFGKPMILSTGGGTMAEVKAAVQAVKEANRDTPLALMHCVSNYPTTPSDANLACMSTMRSAFGLPVGFSDHTLGNATSIAAAALGAEMLEKHFTLDRKMNGPDHALSADPEEFADLVTSTRAAFEAVGRSEKAPVENADFVKAIRRSVTAFVPVAKGVTLTRDMLAFKRPGTGIAPDDVDKVIGKKAARDICEDQTLIWDDLEG
ncbi:MAG: hypothetical protein A2516_08735 [Alphaproteobacteria bacterium RIFOXYD12_FULL_60_8]|nr:MAG: hypothetical protein A2516_08735 [Alphaproteobacteria bacterium RIFOXYD12_FULL_60_8]